VSRTVLRAAAGAVPAADSPLRQCDLKVAWVSVPQVNARRNRLFHHSFPTQTGVAGNSRV